MGIVFIPKDFAAVIIKLEKTLLESELEEK